MQNSNIIGYLLYSVIFNAPDQVLHLIDSVELPVHHAMAQHEEDVHAICIRNQKSLALRIRCRAAWLEVMYLPVCHADDDHVEDDHDQHSWVKPAVIHNVKAHTAASSKHVSADCMQGRPLHLQYDILVLDLCLALPARQGEATSVSELYFCVST